MVSFTSLPLTNLRRGFGLLSFFRGRSVEFSSVVVVLVVVVVVVVGNGGGFFGGRLITLLSASLAAVSTVAVVCVWWSLLATETTLSKWCGDLPVKWMQHPVPHTRSTSQFVGHSNKFATRGQGRKVVIVVPDEFVPWDKLSY
jgi:hypothetical protein